MLAEEGAHVFAPDCFCFGDVVLPSWDSGHDRLVRGMMANVLGERLRTTSPRTVGPYGGTSGVHSATPRRGAPAYILKVFDYAKRLSTVVAPPSVPAVVGRGIA